jgi:hypothetical protein
MPADLQAIAIGANVIGMMDGPGRQPQHFARKRGQQLKARGFEGHGAAPKRGWFGGMLAGANTQEISNFWDRTEIIGIKY